MPKPMPTETQLRTDLAAAFRWAARLNWHESVGNHFSAALSEDGTRFLLNPNGSHFSRIRASQLLALDVNDPATLQRPDAPDPTAWFLHSELHRRLPRARCIMHTHMPQSTALCCLKGYEFQMLDQDACRYHHHIAYDRDYQGMALDADEGARAAALLDEGKTVLFMGNHGVLVIAESVAEAFDELYYLERAATLQVLALSTGRELAIIPETVAARTCAQWRDYPTDFAELHLKALKDILDDEEPSYKL